MSTAQPLVVVAGATGYCGRYITAALHDRGYRVRVLVRSRKRAELPGSYGAPSLCGLVDDWVLTTTQDLGTQPGLLDDADHVVSALGVTRQKVDPWEVDFQANLRLLRNAERSSAASFTYINVMHADRGTSLLLRAKSAFSEVVRRSPVPAQIINPSAYFSDISQVFDMARRGLAIQLGDGRSRLNPIHGADLADFCLAHLGTSEGTWEVGGPDVYTYRQIMALAFDALTKTPRRIAIPSAAIGPSLWFTDRLGPRVASLSRFLVEGLMWDGVGQRYGTRHLRDHFAALAGSSAS